MIDPTRLRALLSDRYVVVWTAILALGFVLLAIGFVAHLRAKNACEKRGGEYTRPHSPNAPTIPYVCQENTPAA